MWVVLAFGKGKALGLTCVLQSITTDIFKVAAPFDDAREDEVVPEFAGLGLAGAGGSACLKRILA